MTMFSTADSVCANTKVITRVNAFSCRVSTKLIVLLSIHISIERGKTKILIANCIIYSSTGRALPSFDYYNKLLLYIVCVYKYIYIYYTTS